MKITIYTIKDCAFSKQEKEYLNANKLVFEEKDLETNKDFLTEMLAVSNNFAGTPVTRVEKDDGTISVLKGFTKEEFDTTFGFATPPTTPTTLGSENPTPTADTPIQPFDVAQGKPTTDSTDLTNSTDSTDSTSPTSTVDPLKSVIDDLQSKSEPFDSAQGKPTPADSTSPTSPPIRNDQPVTPPPADAPAIPDFPAK